MSSMKNAQFVPIGQQTQPPHAILVSDWSISNTSSPLNLLCNMNRNLVGSIYMYGRFCIKFPQSRMKGERHRLSPLCLWFCYFPFVFYFPYREGNTAPFVSYFPYKQGNTALFVCYFHTPRVTHHHLFVISCTQGNTALFVCYCPHTQGNTALFVCYFPYTQGNTALFVCFFPYTQGNTDPFLCYLPYTQGNTP